MVKNILKIVREVQVNVFLDFLIFPEVDGSDGDVEVVFFEGDRGVVELQIALVDRIQHRELLLANDTFELGKEINQKSSEDD